MIFKDLTRFFRLPGEERTALVRAALALAGSVLSLRLLGVRRTLRWAGRAPRIRCPAPSRAARTRIDKLAVDRAAVAMRSGTCLSKSVALQLLLRRRGIASELRLGIRRREGSELLAHAWLERNGHPIDEHDPGGTRLPAFPRLGGPGLRDARQ